MRGIGKIGSRPSSLGTPPTMMARPPTSNGTPKPFGVSRDGDGPAPNNSNQVDRRNLKVVRIRQPGPPAQQSAHRPTGAGSAVPYQPSTTSLNREISEISEKYHNRVVPGSTVQQFNDIVNQMSQELTRMVNEQTNHRQYTDQLALTHATEMELKDEKIRHLEHTIEMLQSKLLVAYKKNQLNVLKHETKPDPALAADKKKRLIQDPEEFEPIRKVPRFNKDFEEHDEEEELFSGSGLDGDDEDDTEVDEEARQVTL
uniref:Uncharacterized protein n=1 Tax=Ditylenchus dipsaci TaxID=166011 RepID=A0A915EHA1_9BILA